MKRTKNTIRNIIWGILAKTESIFIPFAVRTVMIYTMGVEYTGLDSLFTSLLNVLNLTELGIGSALTFSMYRPMEEGDNKKICALLNFYKRTYAIIGCVVLGCGLVILPFLRYFVEGDIPDGVNMHILFLIYLCNSVSGYFLYAYYNSLLNASQRMDVVSKIMLSLKAASGIIQIILLLAFRNYYLYVIVLPVVTCIINICVKISAEKRYPQYRCKGTLDKKEFSEISLKIGGLTIQKLGGIVLTSVDTIVISSFLGLRILGIYNGYYYVITALFALLSVVTQALVPAVGNLAVTDDKEKIYERFRICHFVYCWLVVWWSACLISLYQPFIRLWQGGENLLDFSAVILFAVYFTIHKIGDISGTFKDAMGLWWQGKLVPLLSSALNLTLNIYLVQKIGLVGILLSTIVSIGFINIPLGGWVLFKHYFVSRKKFIRYLLMEVYYLVIMAAVAFPTWKICELVQGKDIYILAVRALICIILPNLLLLLLCIINPDFKVTANFALHYLPQKFVPQFIKKRIK